MKMTPKMRKSTDQRNNLPPDFDNSIFHITSTRSAVLLDRFIHYVRTAYLLQEYGDGLPGAAGPDEGGGLGVQLRRHDVYSLLLADLTSVMVTVMLHGETREKRKGN